MHRLPPEIVLKVAFAEPTSEGHLRHPTFSGVRTRCASVFRGMRPWRGSRRPVEGLLAIFTFLNPPPGASAFALAIGRHGDPHGSVQAWMSAHSA